MTKVFFVNPIRPGLFSRSPGPRGAQSPGCQKSKLTSTDWNEIQAFLVQNLRLIAPLVLEIWRHKISLGRRERVIRFGYLPLENGKTFKKMGFYVQNRSSRPKTDPPPPRHVSFSNFQAEEKVFIFKIFGTSRWEKGSSNPLIDQFY